MHIYTFIVPPSPKKTPPPLPFKLLTAQRLISLRKAKGLTQEALAEIVGISRKQISDYELGRSRPNDEVIVRFALALGVSTDSLLGLDDIDISKDSLSLRFTRRVRELDQLPEAKKKAILKTLDDLIRANS